MKLPASGTRDPYRRTGTASIVATAFTPDTSWLENYTYLTLRISARRTNVYAGVRQWIWKGISNAAGAKCKDSTLTGQTEGGVIYWEKFGYTCRDANISAAKY
jgi:hypothetical protein